MKIAGMKTKDLEYCIKLVDKTIAGFERTDTKFEKSSAVGKILSHSTHHMQRNCS